MIPESTTSEMRREVSPEGERTAGLTARQFEEMLSEPPQERYLFRLFVSGTTVRSTAAITNVRSLFEKYLCKRYALEVIDVYQQREAARMAKVIATPTLIKESPSPIQRFIGDMSNTEKLIAELKLKR